MYMIRHGTRIRIDAPAKLNLFLELRRRRRDGYHELETLMVPISVYDSLVIQPREDELLNLHCAWAPGLDAASLGSLPPVRENLAYRAIDAVRQAAGISQGADVWIQKRIPAEAGLGGASSDAAAAIVAGNTLWQLGWSRQRLSEIAADLGSDVPFFLADAPALCTGRGEIVRPLRVPHRMTFVLIKPAVGLSTADVYRRSTIPSDPVLSTELRAGLQAADLMQIGKLLFNRLQRAAAELSPWIARMAAAVASCDVCGHQMSGSGTTYYALCRNLRHARQIAARLRAIRLGNVLTVSTLGPYPA